MKKTMKYETPEFEITRFQVETRLMTFITPGGDDDDEEFPTHDLGGNEWISIPDYDFGE